MSDKYNLSEDERNQWLPSGVQKVMYNRVAWAKQYLKDANLIESVEKGTFKITSKGLDVLKVKIDKINSKFLKDLEKDFSQSDIISNNEDIIKEKYTPEEMIEKAKVILSAHLENNLLEHILENSPTFFEKLVIKLLFKMEYGGSEKDIRQSCGKSGDGGIDGIINQDVLGLDQIHIQAKRYKIDNIVQVSALRDFCGALYGKKNPKGVFITTSSFTKPAWDFAKDNDLILIDGKKLTKLMIEYNIGVQVKEVIEIKKIDIDFFEEDV